jgi:hypothetical protein
MACLEQRKKRCKGKAQGQQILEGAYGAVISKLENEKQNHLPARLPRPYR